MKHKRLLIEDWLPIQELGIESLRERTPMTPFPAPNRLHVWWARRPLIASRAAVLASVLPADFDHETFRHILGIHGYPVAAKVRIQEAKKTGKNLGTNPYGYSRSFQYNPSQEEILKIRKTVGEGIKILDPTAGGGSIPLESLRLGFDTLANDLNPVVWFIQKATLDFPRMGEALLDRYNKLSQKFKEMAESRFKGLYPIEKDNSRVDGYLYSRTIHCPSCGGLVPLSPNWKISKNGHGVKLISEVQKKKKTIRFEIVKGTKKHSPGTVKGGIATCPHPDCGENIPGEEVKKQAQEGNMGDILYAIVLKRSVPGKGKKAKMVRDFRAPEMEDDVEKIMADAWKKKQVQWEAEGILPDEQRYIGPADRSANYGLLYHNDLFSSRQLYGHCTGVEIFREILAEEEKAGRLDEITKAAMGYLAISLDKILNWNSNLSTWNVNADRMRSVFDRHDFSFKWDFAEMATTITGAGYDWAFTQTGKSLKELIELVQGNRDLFNHIDKSSPNLQISLGSAENLRIESESVSAIVMDPPYYDNVMYAELSDFFYVWLKRTVGLIYPEAFQEYLTDKDREAVANPAHFKGKKKAKAIAGQDYQKRMGRIFTECHRVLKPEGAMTVMFTHKASGAWDALATGLVQAGFTITASWPVNTEAEGSLHIKDKAAAKSTIFLVCRKFAKDNSEVNFWEDVEPLVAERVRGRIAEFQKAGILGVDLYLASFGPALEIFSEKWPLQRGTAREKPKGYDEAIFGNWDPYAVNPEDALDSARSVVKQWRLEKLLRVNRQADFDKPTEFFILAWDAFNAPKFPADEALKLARVIGLDFDKEVKGKLVEVSSGTVTLLDSKARKDKGKLVSPNSGIAIDAIHSAAYATHQKNAEAGKKIIEKANLMKDPQFQASLEALLKVLPPTTGSDFEALNNLRKTCFEEDQVADPKKQLILFKEAQEDSEEDEDEEESEG